MSQSCGNGKGATNAEGAERDSESTDGRDTFTKCCSDAEQPPESVSQSHVCVESTTSSSHVHAVSQFDQKMREETPAIASEEKGSSPSRSRVKSLFAQHLSSRGQFWSCSKKTSLLLPETLGISVSSSTQKEGDTQKRPSIAPLADASKTGIPHVEPGSRIISQPSHHFIMRRPSQGNVGRSSSQNINESHSRYQHSKKDNHNVFASDPRNGEYVNTAGPVASKSTSSSGMPFHSMPLLQSRPMKNHYDAIAQSYYRHMYGGYPRISQALHQPSMSVGVLDGPNFHSQTQYTAPNSYREIGRYENSDWIPAMQEPPRSRGRPPKPKTERSGPKRPMSAFLWFSKEKRQEIRMTRPGMSLGELTKELSRRWKELSEEDKETWKTAAQKDKLRYEQERVEWEEKIISKKGSDRKLKARHTRIASLEQELEQQSPERKRQRSIPGLDGNPSARNPIASSGLDFLSSEALKQEGLESNSCGGSDE